MTLSRVFAIALCMAWARSAVADDIYIASQKGDSCSVACGAAGRLCIDSVDTQNRTDIFAQVGLTCQSSAPVAKWFAVDQPSVAVDPSDPNYGKCLGYTDVPTHGSCQGRYWSVRRVCHCGDNIMDDLTFGIGLSGGEAPANETKIFSHIVSSGNLGVMTHFWSTAPGGQEANVMVRYYVDNETTASIAFTPPMAAGAGFNDQSMAPWGTKWAGLGAGNKNGAAWFNNIRVPFQSITITVQGLKGAVGGFYMIVRGALQPADTASLMNIGGIQLPQEARLKLQVNDHVTLQPVDFLDVVNVPSPASGFVFMTALAVSSKNLNFLEGCYHLYTPPSTPFPGTVLSTGTEDFYDSGWYFDAGNFHMPVSGFTHLNDTTETGEPGITWSAYRYHEMDPILFDSGVRFQWRNGDMVDPHSGLKCFTESGGKIVGSPSVSNVTSYGWVYVY